MRLCGGVECAASNRMNCCATCSSGHDMATCGATNMWNLDFGHLSARTNVTDGSMLCVPILSAIAFRGSVLGWSCARAADELLLTVTQWASYAVATCGDASNETGHRAARWGRRRCVRFCRRAQHPDRGKSGFGCAACDVSVARLGCVAAGDGLPGREVDSRACRAGISAARGGYVRRGEQSAGVAAECSCRWRGGGGSARRQASRAAAGCGRAAARVTRALGFRRAGVQATQRVARSQ